MRIQVVLATLGFCLILPGQAEAQEVSNKVIKVMKEAGCNMGWYAQVLIDSGTGPVQLSGGNKACKQEPPAEIAKVSEMLLRAEASSKQTQDFRKEISDLKRVLAEKETEVRKPQAEIERPIASAPVVTTITRTITQNDSRVILATGLASFFLGLSLAILYYSMSRTRKSTIQLARVRIIRDLGKTYQFILVGAGETTPGSGVIVGKYKCLKCSEKNLFGPDQKLVDHLREKHPEERITWEIDPALVSRSI